MSSAAQVLYITYDGLLEPLGASQVLPYVRGLVGRGFRFEIISFEKPVDLARTDEVESLRADLSRIGVYWRPLRFHKRPTLPATAWDVWSARRHVGRWIRARNGRPSVVHARGYLPGFMGLAAQAGGGRLLFDMRGLWVDERIEAGYWRTGSSQVAVGRWIERTLLARSDHLVVLAKRGTRHLQALAGGSPVPRWTRIPTCVDLDRFTAPVPEERRAARDRLGLGGAPVLVHAGALGGWYEGARTMRLAKAFVERTGGTFVVLTRDPPQAQSLAREAGVEVRIHTASPNEVPEWLRAADAGVALVRVTRAKEASVPVKFSEYLASGLPVVSTPVGDLEDLADEDLVRLLQPEEAVDGAAAWLSRPWTFERASAARRLAADRFSLSDGVAALDEIYQALGVRPGESP